MKLPIILVGLALTRPADLALFDYTCFTDLCLYDRTREMFKRMSETQRDHVCRLNQIDYTSFNESDLCVHWRK